VRRWLFAAGFMIIAAVPIAKFLSADLASVVIFLGLLAITVVVVWWGIDKIRQKK